MSSPVQTPKSPAIHQDQNQYENDAVLRETFDPDETLNREPDPREDPTENEGSNHQEIEEDEGVEKEPEEENGAQGDEVSSGMNDDVQMTITEGDVSATTARRLTYTRRKKGKGKGKSNAKKELAIREKLESLRSGLNPIPFIPHKFLDFSQHERILKKLGLWDFVNIDFDRSIRVDLIAQLVASYEPKSRASFVNGFRIMVNRADLGRALKLLVKKEKGNVGGVGGEGELDWEVSLKDCVGFIEQFLFDWLLLHEDTWLTPKEVLNWLNLIRDGHPEKVDWASLIWFMVEKELALGASLKNCYYASHMQLLIKSQRQELFLVNDYTPHAVELEMESKEEEEVEEVDEEEKNDDANDAEVNYVGDASEEGKEVEGVNAVEDVEGKHMELCATELTFATHEEVCLTKEDSPEDAELYEESKEDEEEEKHDEANDAEVNYGRDVNGEGKQDEWVNDEGDVEERKEEENCLMGGPSTKLTLGQEGEEEEEEMKEMELMHSEKYKDNDEDVSEEDQGQGQWLFHGKNDLGEPFMQRCDNDGEFGNYEVVKEEEEDYEEDVEQEEDEEEEDIGDEPVHVFPDDDSLEGNGLMGNLLQTIEGNQIAFGSQQQFHPSSSVEMQHMGPTPSFLNHSGKRAIDHGSDIPHHGLNGSSNKRIRINDSWDNRPMDFGTCMDQIQQMAEKARIMYEQKEQDIEETSMNQRILLSEVEKRDAIIDQLHKMRMEEAQKKDTEIYRLNRELRLMESVIDGYRKALKETQKAFEEYRERAQLKEEPVYRDAWPGGLMLSISEIESFQKEYEMKFVNIGKQVNDAEGYFVKKLSSLDDRLRGLEAEAKEFIQLNMIRKNKKAEAEKAVEVDEDQPTLQNQEAEAEKVSQVDKDQPTLQIEEEATEVAEPVLSLQTEETATEEEETPSIARAEGEMLEASESLTNE